MVARLYVNGSAYELDDSRKLLPFLRDDLRLVSVKDGCSEGACGTCTVLMDGKAEKACVLTGKRANGKHITTVEGLPEHEREIYVKAFVEAGAVQCGFCIPGMVLSAKALLDNNKNPSDRQIREAIKNNICRCTGYQKIISAIKNAGQLLFEIESVDDKIETRIDLEIDTEIGTGEMGRQSMTGIGMSVNRVDAAAKVLGEAIYTNDMYIDGMLYGGAVRSKHPRALIKYIDISKAKAADGVNSIITAADLKGAKRIGHIQKDWDVLIGEGEFTHYIGDAIVLIAADTKEHLAAAKALVEIEYEVYEPITTIEVAKSGSKHNGLLVRPDTTENNLLSTQVLKRGDADGALAHSAHTVTQNYYVPPTEHAFLEPETAIAVPNESGVTIYCGDQSVFQTRRECAEALGLPEGRVHVVGMTVGGGFGGKEDMSIQHHTAILAMQSGRPVKMSLSRAESIAVHPKRHAMQMAFTLGCDTDGYLTALKARIDSDTGAYASLGAPVLQRACTHAAGPYNYHNIDIIGNAYYTNNPPAGAFRGFGVTQSCFAMERTLDMLAKAVGISPWEIRYKNAVRPGQVLPNGQIADGGTALTETLQAVKGIYDSEPYAGIACAMKNAGVGVGLPDIGRCRLTVENGTVVIRSGAACIGQGLATVLTQIVCEVTGLDINVVRYQSPDTEQTPNSGITTASRQTVFTGEATRRAAEALAEALGERQLSKLDGMCYRGEFGFETDRFGSDKPNPVSHISYGYATHLVALNEDGRIKRVVAAHDVGKTINPQALEGQVEGGVVMGLGYALTEDFPLKDGVPTARFGTLGLFKATDVPPIETIIIEKNTGGAAFGAKGVGEICTIPTAPAVAGAYERLDCEKRTTLPLKGTAYRP